MGKHANRLPTEKQRAFLKHYVAVGFADGKGTECAIRAGYSPKNAASRASELKRNPIVQTAMQKALADKGLSLEAMAGEAKRLALDSKHPFAPNMPDNEVRRRTIEMAAKLYDAFPSQKIDINKTEARYDMTIQDVKRLRDYKAEQIIDAEIIEEDGIESF